MSDKLCPKLIFEGTRLTGKTDLAFALNEHPRLVGPRKYRYHSPIVSAECRVGDPGAPEPQREKPELSIPGKSPHASSKTPPSRATIPLVWIV